MEMYNSPIDTLSAVLGHAEHIGFSNIKDRRRNWFKSDEAKTEIYEDFERRPYRHEIELFSMFVQGWGSTALGFGGVGGQAFTDAYTTILQCGNEFLVYFSTRLAYKLVNPTQAFYQDVSNMDLVEVSKSGKYLR